MAKFTIHDLRLARQKIIQVPGYFVNTQRRDSTLDAITQRCFHHNNLMDYESAGKIFSALLALLFLLYTRDKRNARGKSLNAQQDLDEKAPFNSAAKEPDLISKTEGGIYKAHIVYSRIIAVLIIAVVLLGAVFDSLTRIIVLVTIAALLLVALIGRSRQKNKLR